MKIVKHMTRHASKRIQQRGLSDSDIDFILGLGSEVEGGYLLTRRDRVKIQHRAKWAIAKAQRLEGKRLVMEGETVVTAFHATKKQQKKLV